MSSSIEIIGVNQNKLLEKLPDNFIDVKKKYQSKTMNLTVQEIELIYYESLYKVVDEMSSGLTLLFQNTINRYCFLLNEMMIYYFSGFNWNDDINIENYNSHYILDKNQLVGLIEWYIALSLATNKGKRIYSDYVYLNEAILTVDTYYIDLSDIDFFRISEFNFMELKEGVNNSNCDYYFYTYSF